TGPPPRESPSRPGSPAERSRPSLERTLHACQWSVPPMTARANFWMLNRMTTTTATVTAPDTNDSSSVLDEATLDSFRERAAGFDEAGRFPHDDLIDLRRVGFLAAAAPQRLGGLGFDLATLAAEQRRLARYAPATALSTCMHHYWVGLAATLD